MIGGEIIYLSPISMKKQTAKGACACESSFLSKRILFGINAAMSSLKSRVRILHVIRGQTMIFMTFKSDAFREFFLPNIDNTDFFIFLDKKTFNLHRSLSIAFEVIDHEWFLLADKDAYEIVHHKKSVERMPICGRELVTIRTVKGEIIKGLTFKNDISLFPFFKISLTQVEELTIGKGSSNDIVYDFENLVSKCHCLLKRRGGDYMLIDSSANGVFVNTRRVNRSCQIQYGDVIEVFGLKLIFLGDVLAADSRAGSLSISDRLHPVTVMPYVEQQYHEKHREIYFNRAPRIFPPISYEQVVIEPPASLQATKRKPLLLTIGPSFTMAIPMMLGVMLMILSSSVSSPFMFMGLITAVGSAGLGGVWAYLNLKQSKRDEQENENQRFNLYSNYLIEMSEYIRDLYTQNYNSLHTMHPSASECCKFTCNTNQLWNRNYSHSDFLFCRLGLGNIGFQVDIKVPTEKFSMVYDSLKDKPAMLYENFKTLVNVPVGIDLSKANLYGIAGGKDKEGAYSVVDNLIVQIAANTSYTDTKIVFCMSADPTQKKRWEYIKWLPHVWSKNKSIRYFASEPQEISDVLFELSSILRQRAETDGYSSKKGSITPHYFLFLSDISIIDGELIAKYIFDKSVDYGLTTFVITDSYQNLPNSCENIIQNDENFRGVFNVFQNFDDAKRIDFDTVSGKKLVKFAKTLSDIVIKEPEDNTEMVSSLSFFELYNAVVPDDFNVLEQWRKNRTFSSIKAPIGKKAGGATCYLDIHEKHHGPHGLIAGTTGSGKSETIQTFILSLAVTYSPYDVAFFIIDFKGGGMANLFSDLPHMAGQITNLSGNQIRRAMISIKSENLRRQRLFNEFGVNNINLYTQLYKSGKATVPIPHLLIIIDEFAELKKEEPEFMRELISVAQVGRSLGVHLILATQKPSGTVDDNIWSNAKFRICLRVQDRQDSNDMLHNSDAAFITQAGRGYLQVGNNELYEMFQSGWSGAMYETGKGADSGEIATMITSTGKTALVGNHTKMKRIEEEKRRWYLFLYNAFRTCSGSSASRSTPSDDVVSAVLKKAKKARFNVGTGNSDILDLKNFLSLIPDGELSDDEVLQVILSAARKKNIRLPELKEKTQLEVMVDYLNTLAVSQGFEKHTGLWMPLLKSTIELGELFDVREMMGRNYRGQTDRWSLDAVVGMYDDPHNQTQQPFTVDFAANGHLAVCGTVVSGKSTFLQTLLFSLSIKYSPEELNFYILDFSSGMLSVFQKLPHCGGYITDTDPDKTAKFFTMLDKMIEERKRALNGGNFGQYVNVNRCAMAPILVVVDNFAGFKEKTDNAYEDILIKLSREGVSYGIYLVLTAAGFGISEIQNRIGDNIKTVVSLEMSDKFKYMDVLRTTGIETLPEAGIKGRGLGYVDGRLLEFQTAVALKAEDDYKRNTQIEKICVEIAQKWEGACARKIPVIPEEPSYEDLAVLDGFIRASGSDTLLPIAYDGEDASVYCISLPHTFCYSVTGRRRTGKTNTLKMIMLSAADKAGRKVVIESGSAELNQLSMNLNYEYISSDRQIFDLFKGITDTFIERNQYKKELMQRGCSDEEIFGNMKKYEPIYIFIADLIKFISSVYVPSDGIRNMSGFFENIFEKGFMHNVFFFGCINTDDAALMTGYRAYSLYTEHKTGVHLGGNVAAQRIFNFQNIHFSQMSKPMKKGEGLTPEIGDDTIAKKIVIPFCGGRIS